jgi:hypothetical protein
MLERRQILRPQQVIYKAHVLTFEESRAEHDAPQDGECHESTSGDVGFGVTNPRTESHSSPLPMPRRSASLASTTIISIAPIAGRKGHGHRSGRPVLKPRNRILLRGLIVELAWGRRGRTANLSVGARGPSTLSGPTPNAGAAAGVGDRPIWLAIHYKRRGGLAPTAGAPGCTATCASYPWQSYSYPTNATAATPKTTSTGSASKAPAAATPTASAATTATAEAAASTAASASALGQLYAAPDVFLVEEMESGEADVRKFLFIERDYRARCKIRPRLNVRRRYDRCRCAACQES